MFKICFEELHLHRIQWVTIEENICNLQTEAIIKDTIIINNKFISNYIYAMFENNWNNEFKKKIENQMLFNNKI
jgi:RimJ/RimL family protein N-acetyltransferase